MNMTPNYGMPNNLNQIPVDRQKVDMFIMSNQKYFPTDKIMFLKEKLYSLDESRFAMVSCIELKDPTTLLLISLFLGSWGVDRFMLKDTGMGVLKLLTGGCCGILTIIDWFSVQKKAQEMNFKNIMTMI
jgi:hypothetical protein